MDNVQKHNICIPINAWVSQILLPWGFSTKILYFFNSHYWYILCLLQYVNKYKICKNCGKHRGEYEDYCL
jgi:hypothetical protein